MKSAYLHRDICLLKLLATPVQKEYLLGGCSTNEYSCAIEQLHAAKHNATIKLRGIPAGLIFGFELLTSADRWHPKIGHSSLCTCSTGFPLRGSPVLFYMARPKGHSKTPHHRPKQRGVSRGSIMSNQYHVFCLLQFTRYQQRPQVPASHGSTQLPLLSTSTSIIVEVLG